MLLGSNMSDLPVTAGYVVAGFNPSDRVPRADSIENPKGTSHTNLFGSWAPCAVPLLTKLFIDILVFGSDLEKRPVSVELPDSVPPWGIYGRGGGL